ncbi:MAG: thioesterase [Myxococcales bacterium]|nr:thioesterase [Myxococcales bacterium]
MPAGVTTPYRVIYGDTDQMGVVYYANYLRLFEIGRNEWIRGSGSAYTRFEDAGLFLPVAEASIRYQRSARYDDLLAIHCWLANLKGASLRFEYEIRRDAETLATGMTRHALVDADGRPQRWPPPLKFLVKEWQAQLEDQADG